MKKRIKKSTHNLTANCLKDSTNQPIVYKTRLSSYIFKLWKEIEKLAKALRGGIITKAEHKRLWEEFMNHLKNKVH